MTESRFGGVSGMLNGLLVLLFTLTAFEIGSANGDNAHLPIRLSVFTDTSTADVSCDNARPLPVAVEDYVVFAEACLLTAEDMHQRRDDEVLMFARLNDVREQQGLPKLIWHEGAAEAARVHAADMIRRDYFAHASPEGFSASDRLHRLDRSTLVSITGENLAMYQAGWPDQYDNELLQQNLEGSPRHFENMLNPDFTHVGLAVIQKGSTYMGVQVFISEDGHLLEEWPLTLHAGESLEIPAMLDGQKVSGWRLMTQSGQIVARAYDHTVEVPQTDAGQLELNVLRRVSRTMDDVLVAPVSSIE